MGTDVKSLLLYYNTIKRIMASLNAFLYEGGKKKKKIVKCMETLIG